MSGDIRIPSVGESVSSGLIAQWHKNNGDPVSIGELLLTLDTDKISTEITADFTGTLQILVAEGKEVSIGSVVGRITSENISNSISFNSKREKQEKQHQDLPVEVEAIASQQAPSQIVKRDLRLDRKAPVSPAVNRLAKEHDVDLSLIIGSERKAPY
tara:strand:- start:27 stop:497 length:471 start_codon:yes stop_codon:yes gene_type:complete